MIDFQNFRICRVKSTRDCSDYSAQRPVIEKLCGALGKGGVILFTAGGVDGEITGEMCRRNFYYSSLAEEEYLRILKDMGCQCILLERDQYPEDHVVFIAVNKQEK